MSLLGDGTVDYDLMWPTYCAKDGKLVADAFYAQKRGFKQFVEYKYGVMLGVESYRTAGGTANPIDSRFSTIWYAKCESFD